MIVAKFGGTAVTPRNFICLKRIATDVHRAIVVSAVGKEYKEDVKTTDLLLNYFDSRDEAIWQAIADKYRRLVKVNGVDVDIENMLADAKRRAVLFDKTYCSTLGEELSARVAAAFLGADYVEAERAVRFDGEGGLLVDETYCAIRRLFNRKRAVMGGFYGGDSNGNRRTFSRGGGDVSGAIVAAALNASVYENWTDVNGVCIANPTKVHGVATVDGMSYAEMRLLSLAGAEVLHPDAVAPCEQAAIPIFIGNFFDPCGASTLISSCPSRHKLLSLAEKTTGENIVTTVLHSYPQWQIMAAISRFLEKSTHRIDVLNKTFWVQSDVTRVDFSPRVVRLYSRQTILASLYKSLSQLLS